MPQIDLQVNQRTRKMNMPAESANSRRALTAATLSRRAALATSQNTQPRPPIQRQSLTQKPPKKPVLACLDRCWPAIPAVKGGTNG